MDLVNNIFDSGFGDGVILRSYKSDRYGMNKKYQFNRRSFLKTGGAVATGVATSGCTDESNTTTNDESPDSITESSETDDRITRDEPVEPERDTEDVLELGHFHGIRGQTDPPDTSGHYQRRYEWDAVGGEWWLELQLSKALEEYYDARHRQADRGLFVSDPYDDQIISTISSEFEHIGDEYGLSDRQVVDLAMAFVQQLQYTPDEVATGFSQYTYYPIQTLIDRGGDCEDTTILLAAILRDLGYGSVLIALWDAEHMALGVKGDSSISGTYYEYRGERYYYVETTGRGWRVGEMPPTIENAQAEIQDIHHHPTLVYHWETKVENDNVIVDTSIRNVGRGSARNISFYTEFEDQAERAHTHDEIAIGSLGQDDTATERLVLQPPDDETLRANTALLIGDAIHDVDRSEWRHPV